MPLVVPGITSNSQTKTDDWSTKLLGKKLGDNTDQFVSERLGYTNAHSLTTSKSFAKKDLPEEHRVVKEGDMMTM